MLPNLPNTLLGILLVYAVMLDPARLHEAGCLLPASGVVMFLLAQWVRPGGTASPIWFSGRC